jgi:hypothetical protein
MFGILPAAVTGEQASDLADAFHFFKMLFWRRITKNGPFRPFLTTECH